MKKVIITCLIISGLALLSMPAYSLYQKTRRYPLDIKSPAGLSISIYRGDATSKDLVSHDIHSQLPSGQYTISNTANDKFAAYSQTIDMEKGMSLAYNPDYSTKRLTELLKDQQPAINQLLKSKYKLYANHLYSIKSIQLYRQGDWCGLKFTADTHMLDGDPVRAILHYQDGKWQVSAAPDILLSSQVYNQIPVSVIQATDQL